MPCGAAWSRSRKPRTTIASEWAPDAEAVYRCERDCLEMQEIWEGSGSYDGSSTGWDRTESRNLGNVPSTIACLIARMMSRYRARLCKVARVE